MFKKRLVLPGECIGTVKEYRAGKGTFVSDNKIYSKNLGVLSLNDKDKTLTIDEKNPLVIPEINDIIIGQITEIKSMLAIVEIEKILGKKRMMCIENIASLHVSEISQSYVKSISTEFKVNDIILAKIIQVRPSIQISTIDEQLGVIIAKCNNCKQSLIKKENILKCINCNIVYHRKTSSNYGNHGKFGEIIK